MGTQASRLRKDFNRNHRPNVGDLVSDGFRVVGKYWGISVPPDASKVIVYLRSLPESELNVTLKPDSKAPKEGTQGRLASLVAEAKNLGTSFYGKPLDYRVEPTLEIKTKERPDWIRYNFGNLMEGLKKIPFGREIRVTTRGSAPTEKPTQWGYW